MKQCSKCKETKSLEAFNKKPGTKDGKQYICKDCSKFVFKQYYELNATRHKATILRKKKENRDKIREFLIQFLEAHPCVDCGETNILTLEFDHLKDKKHEISTMIQGNRGSAETVKREIGKCQVLCANCHAKKTHKDQNTYKWRHVNKWTRQN